MKKLNLAYFGTPDFSARFLEKILTDVSINQLVDIKLVVTQPDKPVGRKQILSETAVKQIAKKYQILNIKYQKDIRNLKLVPSEVEGLEIRNFDLALVYAYGEIIPKELLSIPKYGFWNIHPSLLPKYRGASPIAYPLILGDKKTGVTIIEMDEKIDHGPIMAQQELKILPTDRRADLEIKLTDLAFRMFKGLICRTFRRPFKSATFKTKTKTKTLDVNPQNHSQASYTRLLKKEDGFVPLSILKKAINNEPITFAELPNIIKEYLSKYQISNIKYQNDKLKLKNSSKTIYDLFRGLYPWPGIWTILPNGKRLKILEIKLSEFNNFPTLQLQKVQLEGKKEVGLEIFNKAYKIFKLIGEVGKHS